MRQVHPGKHSPVVGIEDDAGAEFQEERIVADAKSIGLGIRLDLAQLYAPSEAAINKSWKPGDIEAVK